MARTADPTNPACPRCGHTPTARKGHTRGQQRWLCAGCGHSFGPTTGTAVYRLKTPPAEVVHALRIVVRRGSLLAAEELTGHKYETIGRWLRQAAAHAEALTAALVHDLQLSEVEVDEFWSFVRQKGALPKRPAPLRRTETEMAWARASGGAA
jgi:transposase-like protein